MVFYQNIFLQFSFKNNTITSKFASLHLNKKNHDIIKLIENVKFFIRRYFMYKLAILKLKERKYIIQASLFFVAFMVIYQIVDSLNMSYAEMKETYGQALVITNITLNVTMSLLSAFLMHLSTAMVELKGNEGKGSTFGFLSILFGILTYGCTSCVIAFFASIGVAFSVIALPLAGLPYKLISLVLIVIGLFWIRHELTYGKCKVNLKTNSEEV